MPQGSEHADAGSTREVRGRYCICQRGVKKCGACTTDAFNDDSQSEINSQEATVMCGCRYGDARLLQASTLDAITELDLRP